MEIDEIIEDIIDNYPKKTISNLGSLMGLKDLNTLNKENLATVVAKGLQENELFSRLFGSLSMEAQKVVEYLTWFGVSNLRIIDSFYKIKTSIGDYYGNSSDPFIQSIKPAYTRDILLSPGLRFTFKKYIKPPAGFEIAYLDSIENNSKEIPGDDSILNHISAILHFIKQEGVFTRGLEKTLLKKVVKKAVNTFNIYEPLKELEDLDAEVYTLKTSTLLKFLSMTENIEFDDPIGFLKEFINDYTSGVIDQELNIDEILFFPFIKGARRSFNTTMFLKRGRYAAINLIKSLNPNQWVSIENIATSLCLKEETEIFNTIYFGESLTVKVDPVLISPYHYGDLELLDKRNLQNFLVSPLVKGIVMFLHSIGAVDITVSKKGVKSKQNVDSKYLTPYDFITSVRLNQLGLKLFNRTSKYEFKNNNLMEYKFLEDKTIILTKGSDPGIENFFKRIGNKISDSDYIVTPTSFIKECNNYDDIVYNVDRLEEFLNCENPGVWQDLVTKVESRVNPIYNEQELIVVNLPMENREFVEEVINNPLINNLYSMVEGGRIAFNPKNLSVFKNKMKKIGYLIE